MFHHAIIAGVSLFHHTTAVLQSYNGASRDSISRIQENQLGFSNTALRFHTCP